jgi:hypothetical protein
MNYSQLRSDVYFNCRTTSAVYLTADVLRNINNAYHNVVRQIWEAQDGWQFDDLGRGSLPKITFNLSGAVQNYSISTISDVLRNIQRVEVKDNLGDWHIVNPIDATDISVALPEYHNEAGLPTQYDLMGDYLVFYPIPSSTYCTLSNGCSLYVARDAVEFPTSASTAHSPSFAKEFHRILSYSATIDFEEDTNRLNKFILERDNLTKGLITFYSRRNLERRSAIRPKTRRSYQYI